MRKFRYIEIKTYLFIGKLLWQFVTRIFPNDKNIKHKHSCGKLHRYNIFIGVFKISPFAKASIAILFALLSVFFKTTIATFENVQIIAFVFGIPYFHSKFFQKQWHCSREYHLQFFLWMRSFNYLLILSLDEILSKEQLQWQSSRLLQNISLLLHSILLY